MTVDSWNLKYVSQRKIGRDMHNYHYFLVRNKVITENSNFLHKMVMAVVTNHTNIPKEIYSTLKVSWGLYNPKTLILESNVPLPENIGKTPYFSMSVPFVMPTEGVFHVKFDPKKSMPIQSNEKRGRKIPIDTYNEAYEWIQKKVNNSMTVKSVSYSHYESHEKFKSPIWNASVDITSEQESYFVQGCSRAFGLGLLVPETIL